MSEERNEAAIFRAKIVWRESDQTEFPYESTLNNVHWRLRINDFPDEPLFTLFIGDEEWGHFDDWPPTWDRPKSVGQ